MSDDIKNLDDLEESIFGFGPRNRAPPDPATRGIQALGTKKFQQAYGKAAEWQHDDRPLPASSGGAGVVLSYRELQALAELLKPHAKKSDPKAPLAVRSPLATAHEKILEQLVNLEDQQGKNPVQGNTSQRAEAPTEPVDASKYGLGAPPSPEGNSDPVADDIHDTQYAAATKSRYAKDEMIIKIRTMLDDFNGVPETANPPLVGPVKVTKGRYKGYSAWKYVKPPHTEKDPYPWIALYNPNTKGWEKGLKSAAADASEKTPAATAEELRQQQKARHDREKSAQTQSQQKAAASQAEMGRRIMAALFKSNPGLPEEFRKTASNVRNKVNSAGAVEYWYDHPDCENKVVVDVRDSEPLKIMQSDEFLTKTGGADVNPEAEFEAKSEADEEVIADIDAQEDADENITAEEEDEQELPKKESLRSPLGALNPICESFEVCLERHGEELLYYPASSPGFVARNAHMGLVYNKVTRAWSTCRV